MQRTIIKMHSNGSLLRCNRQQFQEVYRPQKQVTFSLPAQVLRENDPIALSYMRTDTTANINNLSTTTQHIKPIKLQALTD